MQDSGGNGWVKAATGTSTEPNQSPKAHEADADKGQEKLQPPEISPIQIRATVVISRLYVLFCKLIREGETDAVCSHISFWWAVPVRVFGYGDAPPPQSNRAVAPEERICVRLLICIFADKLLPDASPSLTNILGWGLGVVLIPEVGADGGGHVDGGDEAEHAGDHQRCSKPVIHHGVLASEMLRVPQDTELRRFQVSSEAQRCLCPVASGEHETQTSLLP